MLLDGCGSKRVNCDLQVLLGNESGTDQSLMGHQGEGVLMLKDPKHTPGYIIDHVPNKYESVKKYIVICKWQGEAASSIATSQL